MCRHDYHMELNNSKSYGIAAAYVSQLYGDGGFVVNRRGARRFDSKGTNLF